MWMLLPDAESLAPVCGNKYAIGMTDESNSHSYFDQSAAHWDAEPRRVVLAQAVGEAILRAAQPTEQMDVLDYGCGTGLLGLFLLSCVRTVTGADSSTGMLEVLGRKIAAEHLDRMTTMHLDLQHDPLPAERFDLIVTSMTMHHVADLERVLRAFHDLLRPEGILCLADLDSEPGVFHGPEAAGTVHHFGFERTELRQRLEQIGFKRFQDVTAHVISRPISTGEEREFPVFLLTART